MTFAQLWRLRTPCLSLYTGCGFLVPYKSLSQATSSTPLLLVLAGPGGYEMLLITVLSMIVSRATDEAAVFQPRFFHQLSVATWFTLVPRQVEEPTSFFIGSPRSDAQSKPTFLEVMCQVLMRMLRRGFQMPLLSILRKQFRQLLLHAVVVFLHLLVRVPRSSGWGIFSCARASRIHPFPWSRASICSMSR